jgi:UDPglucose 6-dehydrogenase
MNDVANLCEIVGADVGMVRKGIGSDSRIGSKFLYPGIGYGGSCFPKDVKALIKTADQNGYSMRVLKAVEDVNNYQKQVLFNKIFTYFKGDLKGKTISIWGLAFKPLTDDMRESPSLNLIKLLNDAGCQVKAYDPAAMREAKRYLGDTIEYAKDSYDAVENADCLVLVTEWNEFRFPDWIRIKSLLKQPVVFDGRNVFDLNEMKANGFDYICIGINTL